MRKTWIRTACQFWTGPTKIFPQPRLSEDLNDILDDLKRQPIPSFRPRTRAVSFVRTKYLHKSAKAAGLTLCPAS